MKNIIILTIICSFISQLAFGKCDWKTIKKNGNIYEYTIECNRRVGELVTENKLRIKQVEYLTQSLDFQNLAINKTEQRVEVWRKASFKLQDRLRLQYTWGKCDSWLHFAGGALMVILGAWAMGQVSKK